MNPPANAPKQARLCHNRRKTTAVVLFGETNKRNTPAHSLNFFEVLLFPSFSVLVLFMLATQSLLTVAVLFLVLFGQRCTSLWLKLFEVLQKRFAPSSCPPCSILCALSGLQKELPRLFFMCCCRNTRLSKPT
jgi:hypothetical protein